MGVFDEKPLSNAVFSNARIAKISVDNVQVASGDDDWFVTVVINVVDDQRGTPEGVAIGVFYEGKSVGAATTDDWGSALVETSRILAGPAKDMKLQVRIRGQAIFTELDVTRPETGAEARDRLVNEARKAEEEARKAEEVEGQRQVRDREAARASRDAQRRNAEIASCPLVRDGDRITDLRTGLVWLFVQPEAAPTYFSPNSVEILDQWNIPTISTLVYIVYSGLIGFCDQVGEEVLGWIGGPAPVCLDEFAPRAVNCQSALEAFRAWRGLGNEGPRHPAAASLGMAVFLNLPKAPTLEEAMALRNSVLNTQFYTALKGRPPLTSARLLGLRTPLVSTSSLQSVDATALQRETWAAKAAKWQYLEREVRERTTVDIGAREAKHTKMRIAVARGRIAEKQRWVCPQCGLEHPASRLFRDDGCNKCGWR